MGDIVDPTETDALLDNPESLLVRSALLDLPLKLPQNISPYRKNLTCRKALS